MVVGTKADLEDKREVPTQEAKNWATTFEDCSYLEVSAKRSMNVNEVFQQLLQQILKAEKNKPQKKEEDYEEQGEEPQAAPATPTQGNNTGGKGKKDKKGDCVVQ